jgi:hypothetical protein
MTTTKSTMNTSRPVTPEWIVFAVWATLLAIVTTFHEPWFDEAQAWLIARDATLTQLFTSITHYEGHPPLFLFAFLTRTGANMKQGHDSHARNKIHSIAPSDLL